MKTKYIKPNIHVVKFETQAVLTSSPATKEEIELPIYLDEISLEDEL